jgi:glycosyltransferase involved in cell wall biosynthesis
MDQANGVEENVEARHGGRCDMIVTLNFGFPGPHLMPPKALGKPVAALRRAYVPIAELLSAVPAFAVAGSPPERTAGKRITIAQFGDYADAYWRLANGGMESYYAQKYTLDYIASVAAAPDVEALTVISCSEDLPESQLPNDVRVAGVKLYPAGKPPAYAQLLEAVKKSRPTHLIAMTPCLSLIAWAVRQRIAVLPMFADSFRATGLKTSIGYRLLARLLNSPAIPMVSNHNLAASLDLTRIGVDPAKVFPFDWPPIISPQAFAAKEAPSADAPLRVIFVGAIMETKGVGDAIRAVSVLRRRGRAVELSIIGRGDDTPFRQLVASLGLEAHVHFLGPKPHPDVIAAMRAHDAVLVPSHWSYPEGLPMTLYEALCTRSPLVTSDHPMFALKIGHLRNAVVFPERDAERFADAIDMLASDPDLYRRLSLAAGQAALDYLCPLKYDRVIAAFLNPAERPALRPFSLKSLESQGSRVQ